MQLRRKTSSVSLNMNYCVPIRDIQQHNVFGRRMCILKFDSDPGKYTSTSGYQIRYCPHCLIMHLSNIDNR